MAKEASARKPVKAIIPAAGSGKRLRPITSTLPKALVQVAHQPILGHILEHVQASGITRAVLVISPEGHAIVDYAIKAFPKMRFEAVVQENPKGLGHAVALTRDVAEGDELLIIYGDTIIEADLKPVLATTSDGAIGVREVEDPSRFGVVLEEDGRITKLVEKPKELISHLAIVGVNYIRDSVALYDALDYIMKEGVKTRGEYQLTDAFQRMLDVGRTLTSFPVEQWFDCGTAETLLATNRHLLTKMSHKPQGEGSTFIPPVFVDASATVRHSVVGPNVTIGAGAMVENCVLRDCLVNGEARLTNCNLADSVIGYSAEVHWPPQQLVLGDYTTIDGG
jgi:glucose-1-phosphate thymidylyltransferase